MDTPVQQPDSQSSVATTTIPPLQKAPQPPPVQVSPPVGHSQTPKKRGLKLLVVLVLVLLLFVGGTAGVAFAVAYDKLSLGNPDLERKITKVVMDLPFTPKSAEYVLVAASMAQTKVTKQSFDVSVAIQTGDSQQLLGLGLTSLDVAAKGNIDYTDPENIKTDLNLSITKDFNMDIKKNDTVLYFKLNQLPSTLLALLNVDTTKLTPVLAHWVAYDTKTLETQASKYLDETKEIQNLSYEEIDQEVSEFLDEKTLSQMELTSDTLDGHAVHKLHFAPTAELIDEWYEKIMEEAQKNSTTRDYYQFSEREAFKLSEYLTDVVSDTWIDKKTHFVRKNVVAFKVKSNSPSGTSLLPGAMMPLGSSQNSDIAVALVAQFDKFGESFTVDVPQDSISTEEFIRQIQIALTPVEASGSASVQGASTSLFDLLLPSSH